MIFHSVSDLRATSDALKACPIESFKTPQVSINSEIVRDTRSCIFCTLGKRFSVCSRGEIYFHELRLVKIFYSAVKNVHPSLSTFISSFFRFLYFLDTIIMKERNTAEGNKHFTAQAKSCFTFVWVCAYYG